MAVGDPEPYNQQISRDPRPAWRCGGNRSLRPDAASFITPGVRCGLERISAARLVAAGDTAVAVLASELRSTGATRRGFSYSRTDDDREDPSENLEGSARVAVARRTAATPGSHQWATTPSAAAAVRNTQREFPRGG